MNKVQYILRSRDYLLFSFFLFTTSLLCLFFTHDHLSFSCDLTTSPIQLNWTLRYSYLAISYWFLYLPSTSRYCILHNC